MSGSRSPATHTHPGSADTKEHWNISTNITLAMSTDMPTLVFAAKLWVLDSIDKHVGVDD